MRHYYGLFILCCLIVTQYAMAVTTVSVDFSEPAYYPLLKGKASVFQEGLPNKPNIATAMEPLAELKVRTFRALTNQGGSNEIFEQGGRLQVRKNSSYETFIHKSQQYRIFPMLTLYQTPIALRAPGSSRKSPPVDFKLYGQALGEFVELYAGMTPLMWEVWNEPQGKAFLDSDDVIGDYNRIYRQVAPAIRAADPDALIVGPAMANQENVIAEFNQAFVDNVQNHDLPLDYFSIHSYGRFQKELYGRKHGADDRNEWIVNTTRKSIGTDFQTVPLVFTEYEYYPAGADIAELQAPREFTTGAVKFLGDLDYFLEQTDIPFVTWNRYLNKGPSHRPGGLTDYAQRRRPIYHAFRLYGLMPTERKRLRMTGAPTGLDGFASADKTGAGILLWNDAKQERKLNLSFKALPFAQGTVALYRIDQNHASYLDGGSEACLPVWEARLENLPEPLHLNISGPGILYLDMRPDVVPPLFADLEAQYIRSWQWAGRTEDGVSGDYGDFDWRTWRAHMGVKGLQGRGLCAVTLDRTPAKVGFRYNATNLNTDSNRRPDINALLGLRIDYVLDRQPVKSVLLHGPVFHSTRNSELPWAGGGTTADEVIDLGALIGNNHPFEFDVEQKAPADWNADAKRRTIISFWMENTGPESQAVVQMSGVGQRGGGR